ncbi:MAG TPA: DMT family transporter [Burkholderiaceae bacterium]
MPQRFHGIFALLLVTIVWGTTFPAMKELSGYFSAAWIIFIRFCIAALLLSPFLLRAEKRDLKLGFKLGCVLFLSYVFQIEGLALTSANRNAFICGMNILVVPVFGMLAGRWPERRIVLATGLSVLGLFALCWDGGSWTFGDSLAFGAALTFGLYVFMLERYSRQASNTFRLTAVQITLIALFAGVWQLASGGSGTHAGGVPGAGNAIEGVRLHFYNLLYLGVVATAAIISLQVWGQKRTSANEAAIIYSFEPACAAVAAYFWIGETMTLRSMLGAALVVVGLIVSQWQPRKALEPAGVVPQAD